MRYPEIKVTLIRRGLRQVDVARRLGRDPAWLSRVIHGWLKPSPEDRRRLSVILKEPESRLFQ